MNILEYEMIEILKRLETSMVFLKLKQSMKVRAVDKQN